MIKELIVIASGIVCIVAYNNEAYGQVDLSSQFLLRKSTSSVAEESLENSRYSRKRRTGQSIKKTVKAKAKLDKSNKNKAKATSVKNPKGELIKEKGSAEVGLKSEKTIKGYEDSSKKSRPSELEIIGELIPSRGTKATRAYFRNIDGKDSRRNILEIKIAPLYFYAGSDSNFWYRDYKSYGPGLGLGATVWFSPFLGIRTDIKSSLSSDIVGNTAGTDHLAADHLWVDVGFVFRRFSTLKKESSILEYGLAFRDYALKIPSDATERVNLNSSGVVLSVELRGEQKNGERNFWGVEIVPKASHVESYAAVDIQSGNDNETNSIGLWIGKEYEFSRKQKIFWKLKHTFEKNLFGGSANVVDPETAVAPSGVVVNQNQTFFQFGISFAN